MTRKSQGPGLNTAVATHLKQQLGPPFSDQVEVVDPSAQIRLLGFADRPAPGQVTLVTDGLAKFARDQGFAKPDGYAQELVLVVADRFFGEEIVGFFSATVSLYASHRELLDFHTPIRLSSPVPGGQDLRFLVPSPAAVFDVEFQFVHEPKGATNLCLMIPAFESEAHFVMTHGPSRFYEIMERLDVEISDLRRRSSV